MPSVAAVDQAAVEAAVVRPDGNLCAVECVAETGSTNADLIAAAAAGAVPGLVRIAEFQNTGRGRFTRQWVEAPGAGIAMSVLLRSAQPVGRWGWIPLLMGLAVRDGIVAATGAPALLKWPNDVLIEDGPAPGKLCGLLAETAQSPAGPMCVLGMGINVAMARDELPVPTATSLLLNGYPTQKTPITVAVLRALDEWWGRFESGLELRFAYAQRCATIGRRVRVQLDAEAGRGEAVEGECTGVDDAGALLVRDDAGRVHALSAGDAQHVRPA